MNSRGAFSGSAEMKPTDSCDCHLCHRPPVSQSSHKQVITVSLESMEMDSVLDEGLKWSLEELQRLHVKYFILCAENRFKC